MGIFFETIPLTPFKNPPNSLRVRYGTIACYASFFILIVKNTQRHQCQYSSEVPNR
ncbi:hypothetical protein ACQJ5I_00915 [Helicobacter pylori]|nr:hypothetical protein [Helicobacter pylori]